MIFLHDGGLFLTEISHAVHTPLTTMAFNDATNKSETPTGTIVAHNMQQAARVSDRTAFFFEGDLVEYGETGALFTRPREPRTEAYITGRFG